MELTNLLWLIHSQRNGAGVGLCSAHNIQVCSNDSHLLSQVSCNNCPLAMTERHKSIHHPARPHVLDEVTGNTP